MTKTFRSSLVSFLALLLASQLSLAKEVSLKWKTLKGAKAYFVEVSKDPTFSSKPVLDKKLKDTVYKYDLKSGMYYVRVRGIDKLDRPGHWSKPFRLVVTAPIVPTAKASDAPKKVVFHSEAPEVESNWDAGDKTTSYRVKVVKNGQEVFSKDVSSPKVDFKPTVPGEYKVQVQAGYDGFYGPPVTVQEMLVEQKPLIPPKMEMPAPLEKKFSSRKPVDLKWQEVEGAQFYRVKVYKVAVNNSVPIRGPASMAPENMVREYKTRRPEFLISKLPPGRYVASVEAHETELSAAPASNYTFDVKKTKPLEFERLDLGARYTLLQSNYSNYWVEGGRINSFNSMGGGVSIDGSMWFPESYWGLKASGSWSGFSANGMSITYNDVQLAAQYRFPVNWLGLPGEVRPFFGGRIWSMPIVTADPGGGNSNGPPNYLSLPTTALGPMAGIDITQPVSEKWAFTTRWLASTPLTNSIIGNNGIGSTKLDPTLSYRVEAGFKYALPGNLRLLALAGYEKEYFQWNPGSLNSNGGGGSSSTLSGKSNISMSGGYATLGIETTTDGHSHFKASKAVMRREYFSDVDLSARYVIAPLNYSQFRNEVNPVPNSGNGSSDINNGSFSNAFNGGIEIETVAWLLDSKHGARLEGSWEGFSYAGATISHPGFSGQWAYQPLEMRGGSNWKVANYFGLRYWEVPMLFMDTTNQFYSVPPGLLGPEESIDVRYKLSRDWTVGVYAQISSPMATVNKQSLYQKVYWQNMSYQGELNAKCIFNEDFNFGFGLGYRFEQLRYMPNQMQYSGAPPIDDAHTSISQAWSPTLSLSVGYSF